MVGLLLLLIGQLVGFVGELPDAAGSVGLPGTAEKVGGFSKAIGGTAGIGRTRAVGGPLHVLSGLAHAIERLLRGGLTRSGGLFRSLLRLDALLSTSRRLASLLPGAGFWHRPGGSRLARLSALTGLARLSALTGLARLSALTRLSLLSLLPLLSLLSLLSLLGLGHLLFHLTLELLSFALQHFLLPFLLGGLLAVALLLGEFILALGQLIELFQRVVHFLRLLLGGLGLGAAFVLILLGVEFQIE